MPSIAAHMALAKLISEKNDFNKEEFIRGNLLPDIIDGDSHKKIKGKVFCIPDIDYFMNTLDLSNALYLGYLSHLLLDKYYLEEFLPSNNIDTLLFANKTMYEEYSIINYKLVKRFDLDVDFLKKVLSDYNVPINKEKLDFNLKFLSLKIDRDNEYLDIDKFSEFLYNISKRINEEVECENKFSKRILCIR